MDGDSPAADESSYSLQNLFSTNSSDYDDTSSVSSPSSSSGFTMTSSDSSDCDLSSFSKSDSDSAFGPLDDGSFVNLFSDPTPLDDGSFIALFGENEFNYDSENEGLTLLDLPNEVLVHVFKFIPWTDLITAIPLICRRFKELLKHKTKYGCLDKVLFRDEALECPLNCRIPERMYLPGGKVGVEYTPHPIFQTIRYTWEKDNRFTGATYSFNGRSIYGTPPMRENATSPATNILQYSASRGVVTFTLMDYIPDRPISVSDVIFRIRTMLDIHLTKGVLALMWWRPLILGEDPWEVTDTTFGEVLGGFSFDGICLSRIESGRITLHINHPPIFAPAGTNDGAAAGIYGPAVYGPSGDLGHWVPANGHVFPWGGVPPSWQFMIPGVVGLAFAGNGSPASVGALINSHQMAAAVMGTASNAAAGTTTTTTTTASGAGQAVGPATASSSTTTTPANSTGGLSSGASTALPITTSTGTVDGADAGTEASEASANDTAGPSSNGASTGKAGGAAGTERAESDTTTAETQAE